MSRGMSRARRLREMERLYMERGYTDQEMADALEVRRETAYEDRIALEVEDEIPFIEVEGERGRRRIDRTKYLGNIRVNLHEGLALYLALRRVSRQTRTKQPHVQRALEKIALTLKQPMTERLIRIAEQMAQQPADPERVKVLEDLTKGWALGYRVRIDYDAMSSGDIKQHIISPYLIEPSRWSDAVYVIAHSNRMGKPTPFNLARITHTFITTESFEMPEEFDEQELLRYAWGIWARDQEPEWVKLKFTGAGAVKRMRETIWHPLQKEPEQMADGSWLWQAPIAEWKEMLPWVRGWGSDVEVMAPERLRDALVREVQKLAELYKVIEAKPESIVHYAHSRKGEDKSKWQLLIDHLNNTADLAERFGADAGISELVRVAALMHDLGKYSQEFQARLDGSGRKVDHATAGAKEIRALFKKDQNQKILADMLAYCIAGHHTGLPDYGSPTDVNGDGTLLARVEKKPLKDYSAYKSEITFADLNLPARIKIKPDKEHPEFSFAFLTRMIFSALVDADFQETETYMNKGVKPRGGHASIVELCAALNAGLQKFDYPQGEINKKRTETLYACAGKAELGQGFFTLTIPTGGGKTLASMAFALNHAVRHGLKRVIYVIPFTSIIEQNAAVFKEYLDARNVLEHHSNFDWKKGTAPDEESADDDAKDALDKLKLASENWDIPIVVTTNVQFFESLFANKSSRCRKLHNIAKSVIIFDEAQTLPREFLDPCMLAVKELVVNYGVSAVICTATQPALNKRLPNVHFTELAPDPQALFDFYKRVQVKNIGRTTDAELMERINSYPQALCIVNTRRHAKGLFDQLEGEGNFHLSTLMCPTHRKEVLSEVRRRLQAGQPCRVISTQVMEAGIDVDFPIGFRALAGLDSIIQAAGRVNREMKRDISDVYVFDPETPFIKKTPTFIKQGAAVAESILREYAECPDSQEAIESYFNFLYNIQGRDAFDAKKILSRFNSGIEFEFKTAAEDFRMIEDNSAAVVIPYNTEARELLAQAKYHPFPFSLARPLQLYSVNIYEREFEKLQSKGVIETINETYQALTQSSMNDFYSEKTGLVLPEDAGGDAIFIDT